MEAANASVLAKTRPGAEHDRGLCEAREAWRASTAPYVSAMAVLLIKPAATVDAPTSPRECLKGKVQDETHETG